MSKKVSLIILGTTSLVCSRTMLVSLDDPEGPNLLVVTVMAGIIYTMSLVAYVWVFLKERKFTQLLVLPPMNTQRILALIGTQIILAIALYFCL